MLDISVWLRTSYNPADIKRFRSQTRKTLPVSTLDKFIVQHHKDNHSNFQNSLCFHNHLLSVFLDRHSYLIIYFEARIINTYRTFNYFRLNAVATFLIFNITLQKKCTIYVSIEFN